MKFEIPVPEWTNWVAQDDSGKWWAYELKPTYSTRRNSSLWTLNDYKTRRQFLVKVNHPENWKNEIYKVVWK